jgi:hypothetical protein
LTPEKNAVVTFSIEIEVLGNNRLKGYAQKVSDALGFRLKIARGPNIVYTGCE